METRYCPNCLSQIVGGRCGCSDGWVTMQGQPNGTTFPFFFGGMYGVDENYVRERKRKGGE